jgi:hypothetical protein
VLIAVAERLNSPYLLPWEEAEFEVAWDKNPLACILDWPNFLNEDLVKRIGADKAETVVNLLPPNRLAGAWDEERAAVGSAVLSAFAEANGASLLLLGRRVALAFGAVHEPFGVPFRVRSVPCMVAPHPSGRCRTFNDRKLTRRLRAEVVCFALLS